LQDRGQVPVYEVEGNQLPKVATGRVTIRYDTIEEINVDSKAEYTA